MYGVRSRSPSRQPKSSNDFGRRPERLPAGKIEFALSPSHLLPPDMAAASSKRHFREPPNLLPPYRKEWSLLHFELDLLAKERKCLLGRFPADPEAHSCLLVSPIRLLPTHRQMEAQLSPGSSSLHHCYCEVTAINFCHSMLWV